MKRFAAALLLLCSVAHADIPCIPQPPPLMHTEIIPVPAGISDDNPWLLMWQCPSLIVSVYFSLADALPWLPKIGAPDPADANTAWNAGSAPGTAAQKKFQHAMMVDRFSLTPLVLDGIAYKRVPVVNGGYRYVRWGKVPIGTACTNPDSTKAGGYMLIDRTKVVKDSPNTALPDNAVALCG